MTSDGRGREGVGENLMISDEGGRGGQAKSDVRSRKVLFSKPRNCLTKKTKNCFFEIRQNVAVI